MIFKLHPKTTRFKPLVCRLLGEELGVPWTAMVNLCTDDPEVAWRIMKATAMSADYLKQMAGVKMTGRQSKLAVLHLVIYWPHDEWPDPPAMVAVAHRALAALKAQDHQALMICHEAHSHPHLHVIINRVSPLDGRMLSSAQEELALLKLFRSYERKRAQDRTEAGSREEVSWQEPA